MLEGYFRTDEKYSYYYVIQNKRLLKFTYNKNTVPNVMYLENHPDTKTIRDCEIINDIENALPIYTLRVYYQGIMKARKVDKNVYDRKLPLMTKCELKKEIRKYAKKMINGDEIYIYTSGTYEEIQFTALYAFKKQNGRLTKIEL